MICFIPCRSGSKSVPHKNIKDLGGKPLIAWSIETGLKLGLDTWVNSDSREYLEIAKKYGAKTMLRPQNLAEDKTTTFEVLEAEIPKIKPYPFDVLLLQPTSPFRKIQDLKDSIEKYKNKDYDSLISVIKIPDIWHPDEAFQLTENGIRMASGVHPRHRKTRRQDYYPSFVPNGSCYLFKTKNLPYGNFYGNRVGIHEWENYGANINDVEDFNKSSRLVKELIL